MEIPKNKVSLSTGTKINIFIMYLFNWFCEYYYWAYNKTYTMQCKLYVYFATRAKRRELSFFDLTSRTGNGLELNIHKALLAKNLPSITHTSDIYDEAAHSAIFRETFEHKDNKSQKLANSAEQTDDFEDLVEDVTYYLRFFAAYYPHSCEELARFLGELQFDISKQLHLTFRLENSGKTYYLIIDLKNAKNALCDKKFAFGTIDFSSETRHELN